jgi:hypothetical protein
MSFIPGPKPIMQFPNPQKHLFEKTRCDESVPISLGSVRKFKNCIVAQTAQNGISSQ